DHPVSGPATISGFEDTAYVFHGVPQGSIASPDFPMTDPNDGAPAGPNNEKAIRIASLPSGGTLKFNGSAVQIGDFIPTGVGLAVGAPSMASGAFTFQPNQNVNGSPLT